MLLGDMLDFVGGPAGLIHLQNGAIRDSYAFFEHRQEAITNAHPEQILGWFGQNGPEAALRARHLAELPPKWYEGDCVSRLIPDEAPVHFMRFIEPFMDPPDTYGWMELESAMFTSEEL